MRLREALAVLDGDVRRMEENPARRRERQVCIRNRTGSEREALLRTQLSTAEDKVLDLEKELGEAKASARKVGTEMASAETAAARAEAAEAEALKLREALAARDGDVRRLDIVNESIRAAA